ncbi:Hypothetical predicted protein [Scomber scombrus]|uniref:Uncharacterized protein n=1 Tax=Scomber scombrus TaxID=13677 RepID=A0AAV1PBH7_SCOSC
MNAEPLIAVKSGTMEIEQGGNTGGIRPDTASRLNRPRSRRPLTGSRSRRSRSHRSRSRLPHIRSVPPTVTRRLQRCLEMSSKCLQTPSDVLKLPETSDGKVWKSRE